jgi:hypothetical protein
MCEHCWASTRPMDTTHWVRWPVAHGRLERPHEPGRWPSRPRRHSTRSAQPMTVRWWARWGTVVEESTSGVRPSRGQCFEVEGSPWRRGNDEGRNTVNAAAVFSGGRLARERGRWGATRFEENPSNGSSHHRKGGGGNILVESTKVDGGLAAGLKNEVTGKRGLCRCEWIWKKTREKIQCAVSDESFYSGVVRRGGEPRCNQLEGGTRTRQHAADSPAAAGVGAG